VIVGIDTTATWLRRTRSPGRLSWAEGRRPLGAVCRLFIRWSGV